MRFIMLFLLSVWSLSLQSESITGLRPVLQGPSDLSTAVFSVSIRKGEALAYFVRDSFGNVYEPEQIKRETRPFSKYGVDELLFRDLPGSGNYVLEIQSQVNFEIEKRDFRLVDLEARKASIAFISCMMDYLHSMGLWQTMVLQKPDLIFFVGDNTYADRVSLWKAKTADPEQLWNRYIQTRHRLHIFKQRQLIPIVATWDDHDVGKNDARADFEHLPLARELFKTFFALHFLDDSVYHKHGPGLARRVSYFGQDFYFLDNRSFREALSSHGKADAIPLKSYLGQRQMNWLLSLIQASHRSSWLIGGSQFFGAYHGKESYEGQALEEFEDLLEGLRRDGDPALFISGDMHFSEVMAIEADLLGFATWEFTSSSAHSIRFPGNPYRFKNPRRQHVVDRNNFLQIDLDEEARQFRVRSFDSGRRVRLDESYEYPGL